MSTPIQIVIVEDHPEYREIVELALEKTDDIVVVGQYGTSERALRAFQDRHEHANADVILLDLNLPGIGGLEAITHFKSIQPNARIIVLTQSNQESDILGAIARGAAGYLMKSSTLREIADGIRTVAAGGGSIDKSIAKYILKTLEHRLPRKEMNQLLTEREQEVLALLAEGLVKKEIATELGIGITTVVTHVANIYQKLDVQNAPAAIAQAFKTGILPVELDE